MILILFKEMRDSGAVQLIKLIFIPKPEQTKAYLRRQHLNHLLLFLWFVIYIHLIRRLIILSRVRSIILSYVID